MGDVPDRRQAQNADGITGHAIPPEAKTNVSYSNGILQQSSIQKQMNGLGFISASNGRTVIPALGVGVNKWGQVDLVPKCT
jgi:hypothetical protein